jgi:hypothetical protein
VVPPTNTIPKYCYDSDGDAGDGDGCLRHLYLFYDHLYFFYDLYHLPLRVWSPHSPQRPTTGKADMARTCQ